MLPDYPSVSGTIDGEIDNETYNKHGADCLLDINRYKGWHNVPLVSAGALLSLTQYDLINSVPVTLLKTETTFNPVSFGSGPLQPATLNFVWLTAGIPFISKEEADSLNLTYPL